ncbi:SUKH-3 domain-containing protein [Lentzea sp. NPDC004782]|uniref:SUKH-3 domain-containing protein n=1 Tax=Lentzea sp. NPDC004782 TaxID=3154458 RepID=UPI0033A290FE
MSVVDSFSPELVAVLEASGWTRGRRVDIEPWHEVLGSEGYHLSDVARELLETLGDLSVHPAPQAKYRADLSFDPELAGAGAVDIAQELEGLFHQRFYPLAEWISASCVFVGEHGKVASYDDVEMLDIGDTVNAAFEAMLLGAGEPRVIRNTHWPRW